MKKQTADLPKLFSQRIIREFGEMEGSLFLAALDEAPLVSVSKRSPTPLWDSETTVPYFPNGVFLDTRPQFTLDPLFHLGHYYPQESSSMFVYHLAKLISDIFDVRTVLDLCAAPGGKSILLHQALPGEKTIVSNEVSAKRSVILCENLIKYADTRSVVTQSPVHEIKGDGQWDLVLLDAPCSGEGMFRKDAEARIEWSPENVLNCQKVQQKLLLECTRLVKLGGYLIYSTCTFSKKENELQCRALIESGMWESWSDFQLPDGAIWKEESGFRAVHFLPHLAKGEGFFCAVFKKIDSQAMMKGSDFIRSRPLTFKLCTTKSLDRLSGWVDGEEGLFWENEKQEIYAFTGDAKVLRWLDRPRMVGIPLGSFLKEKFVPTQGLITSGIYKRDLPTLQVQVQDALNILRGLDWRIDFDGENGWYLAVWNGFPLAWLKWVGNRFSNHYPMDWRIRNL